MIVDANANVGPTLYDDFECDPSLDGVWDALRAAGVDRAVLAPLKPRSFDFDAANASLAARIAGREEFVGIARIDPRVDGSEEQADRALAEYGLRGLKLHPWEETYPITAEIVPPVVEVARDHDVPVWIHAGYPGVSHALSIRRLVSRYPDVRFVLTHGSQLDISGLSLTDAMLLAEETENTYFELSGVYRRDLVEDLVETIGPERVLFGTNVPYFHPTVEKSRVTTADIPAEAKEQVLGGAIEALL
ncbi:MAG: amidohydrolase family protein [Salinigranum sp.]